MRRQSCSLWACLGKEAFPLPPQLHLGSWAAHKARSHQQTSNISNLREGPETAPSESPAISQEALEHFLTVYNGSQSLGNPVGSSIIQVRAHQHTWIKAYFRISHRFCSCEYLIRRFLCYSISPLTHPGWYRFNRSGRQYYRYFSLMQDLSLSCSSPYLQAIRNITSHPGTVQLPQLSC